MNLWKPFLLLHKTARTISPFLPLGNRLPLEDYDGNISYSPQSSSKVLDGQMIAIAGRTGTGKTVFTKAFNTELLTMQPFMNMYILDSKKQGDFTKRDGPIVLSYEPPAPLRGEGLTQIWQPLEDDINQYSKYFLNILLVGKPAIVFIDESKNIAFNGKAPRGYELLTSQGRRPGIWVETLMQECARAPRQAFSQSKHLISFRVYNQYDSNIIKRYMRYYGSKQPVWTGKHSFLHLDVDDMAEAKLYEGYQDFIQEFFHNKKKKW